MFYEQINANKYKLEDCAPIEYLKLYIQEISLGLFIDMFSSFLLISLLTNFHWAGAALHSSYTHSLKKLCFGWQPTDFPGQHGYWMCWLGNSENFIQKLLSKALWMHAYIHTLALKTTAYRTDRVGKASTRTLCISLFVVDQTWDPASLDPNQRRQCG